MSYVCDDDRMTDSSSERDDEGFPPCGPDNEFDTYTDEFEVT